MTTSVHVKCHNFPVKITITDKGYGIDGQDAVSVKFLTEGQEETFHCTTTRTISCVDLEYAEYEAIQNQDL